jgi:hypothetical protein
LFFSEEVKPVCNGRDTVPPDAAFDNENLSISGDFDYQFGEQSQNQLDQLYSADSQNQCIRFVKFQEENWCQLLDSTGNVVPIQFQVDADKGFNFSHSDDSFVCQKKNHFQVCSKYD